MGQEQAKPTMSEPSFAEASSGGQHSLSQKNRHLQEENNYLRTVNNLLKDQEGAGKTMFAEPGQGIDCPAFCPNCYIDSEGDYICQVCDKIRKIEPHNSGTTQKKPPVGHTMQ